MTVKEVLYQAALLVGATDAATFLDGSSTAGENEANVLLRCLNFVENEVALDYLPLCSEETFESETGVIPFEKLALAATRIVSVKDESGNSVAFKSFPDYIKTQPGKVTVAYTYTPKEKALGDEMEYSRLASKRLFAYGVAAEYCLACGLYEEAAVWDKKYKEAIGAAYEAHPPRRLASRRWA